MFLYMLILPEIANSGVLKLKVNNRQFLIPAFTEEGTFYFSLPDFLNAAGIRYSIDSLTGKLYFSMSDALFKITPNNPYIVLLSGASSKIFQMPVDVITGAGKIYVPIEYFYPIFSNYFPYEISFDREAMYIRISKPIAGIYDRNRPYVSGIRIEKRLNGYLIRIFSDRKLRDVEAWMSRNNWLYITIANANVNMDGIQAIRSFDFISKLDITTYRTAVQIAMKLADDIGHYELIPDRESNDILIALYKAKIKEIRKRLENVRRKFLLDVIVIDPGHGGKDPGAIGVYGTREKDVALKIARKLKSLIEKLGVKVVMTRDDDRFVELYRRGQIANESGGKLFISIHCNSMPSKPHNANGFEVYILRPGRTPEAIRIAERENAVIRLEENFEERYKHLTDESYILTAMAHSVYIKNSERFAEILSQVAREKLGLRVKGVNQAGFYVLVGASMPSVLIETGYISNPSEEKFLRSEQGQWRIARVIYEAVRKFKSEYETAIGD
jgi:N-acetylmuramoyl-L-alanine amidase